MLVAGEAASLVSKLVVTHGRSCVSQRGTMWRTAVEGGREGNATCSGHACTLRCTPLRKGRTRVFPSRLYEKPKDTVIRRNRAHRTNSCAVLMWPLRVESAYR